VKERAADAAVLLAFALLWLLVAVLGNYAAALAGGL
jgi:hypothetical protein